MLDNDRFPHELFLHIASVLSFDDVFNLTRTCRKLLQAQYDRQFCRRILKNTVPWTLEFIQARDGNENYARAFRRAAKTRNAISTGRPFSAIRIGFGSSFFYQSGVLCYTLESNLRILDLYNSHQSEVVVDIHSLLRSGIPGPGYCSTYTFLILSQSHGIVSCLYTLHTAASLSWLVAFDYQQENIVISQELQSNEKIFVRNDARYFYYGTYSASAEDERRVWVLRGYDMQKSDWFPNKIYLQTLNGGEIGSTICFRIFRTHFYAVSNKTTYRVEEIDWTSFYRGVRFPLQHPSMETVEMTEDANMWRRQHAEGVIDDRWTKLDIVIDGSTGDLQIVEYRKEVPAGASSGRRTCYTTKLVFPSNSTRELTDCPQAIVHASSSMFSTNDNSISAIRPDRFQLAVLTQDRLALALTSDDNPNYLAPQIRPPRTFHTEVLSTTVSPHMISKTPIRSYAIEATTFVDLVNDPLPTGQFTQQRLRLGTSTRRSAVPALDHLGILLRDPVHPLTGFVVKGCNDVFKDQEMVYWPPDPDPIHKLDGDLEELNNILNPSTFDGQVEGFADARTVVYMTGKNSRFRAMVLLSFDPTIRFCAPGIKKWSASREIAGLDGYGRFGEYDGHGNVMSETEFEYDGRKENTLYAIKDDAGLSAVQSDLPENSSSRRQTARWIWTEPAQYRDIGKGFNFSL